MIAARSIQSDSQDSSDEEQQNFTPTVRAAREKNSSGGLAKLFVGVGVLIPIIVAVVIGNTIIYEQPQQPAPSIKPNDHQISDSLTKVEPKVEPNIEDKPTPPPPPLPFLASTPSNHISLSALNDTKQLAGSFFNWASLRHGTMHWYTLRKITCQGDVVINSASKMGGNLYVQKTAYSKINIIYYSVSIPAQNIYAFEPLRQLIANITKNQQNIIAYCHSSPLLLVLATASSTRPIFVSNSTQWQLFKHNLVINDLLPLAQPYPLNTILESSGYNILISEDFSLITTLLYQQKRDLLLIIEVKEPTPIETFLLLRLKVYRLQDSSECEAKKIQIYEQSGWHLQSNAVLMPAWYAFTTESYPLPLTFEAKQYQKALYSPRKLSCIKQQAFKPLAQIVNHNYVLASVPYQGMHLFKHVNDTGIDQEHYRQIVQYFDDHPVKSMYLHSGSYYLMTLLVATLPKDAKVTLNAQFSDARLLKKNLVLNNLEIGLLNESVANLAQYQLVVSSSFDAVSKINCKYILISTSQQQQTIYNPQYSLETFKEIQQCKESSLIETASYTVPKGSYLLTRKT